MIRTASKNKLAKTRLDQMLVARGMAQTEKSAQAMIMAGEIRVDEQLATKPGTMCSQDARIEFAGEHQKYASRAGLKLEGALEDFGVSPEDRVCLDVGASTGGFTDCLLQHGAQRVYAVDVSTAQLEWRLREDKRVITVEKNARYLRPTDIPEAVDFVTVDVSFISLSKILPAIASVAKAGAIFLILIKPQFELEKRFVGRGGIVTDPALHERAIASVRASAERAGLEILGAKLSRLAGAEGNREFFLGARCAG